MTRRLLVGELSAELAELIRHQRINNDERLCRTAAAILGAFSEEKLAEWWVAQHLQEDFGPLANLRAYAQLYASILAPLGRDGFEHSVSL